MFFGHVAPETFGQLGVCYMYLDSSFDLSYVFLQGGLVLFLHTVQLRLGLSGDSPNHARRASKMTATLTTFPQDYASFFHASPRCSEMAASAHLCRCDFFKSTNNKVIWVSDAIILRHFKLRVGSGF